jgi:hypothetical protein
MRIDLIDRMKGVTKHIDATLEEVLNDSVDRGLSKLELALGIKKRVKQ